MAAIATIDRLLSVTLTASTTPLSASARRRTTPAAALFGGLSSAVTTNSPDLRRLASATNEKTSPSIFDERSSCSVDPLIFPWDLPHRDGIGTAAGLRRLPRRHRAVPSASRDERDRV